MVARSESGKRDVYAHLLRDTRGLRRDQATSRDSWYQSLSLDRKEGALFELEMLLKGLGCYGNPYNHPGPARDTPAMAHDFRDEMHAVRDALDRCIHLVRELLGDRDRAYTFARYLESVLPEDTERTRLVQEQLTQDTPKDSLFVLRNSLPAYRELADGLLRLGRVSHRQHHALLSTVVREIGRNVYFNPLVALEFRPEFDRIDNPAVLEALDSVDSEAAHRSVALTFLTAFRALRYLALIEQYARDRNTLLLAYVLLAALRSDIRTLTRYLEHRAADNIAETLEHELLSLPAQELSERYSELMHSMGRLTSLRSTLQNLGGLLRIDFHRCYERVLPPLDAELTADAIGEHIVEAAAGMRASVHHVINQLCFEIRPDTDPPELLSDAHARREASERLRRDVWMFLKILRGFLAKAESGAGEPDAWRTDDSFRFVREFLEHFRAVGYQLVRWSDYGDLDRFMKALEALRDADILDPARMQQAVAECRAFYEYLEDLFHQISQRDELQDVPFDRKAAADTLRAYLGG